MQRSGIRLFIVVIALVMAVSASFGAGVAAQATAEGRYTGSIESIGSGTAVISGLTFDIATARVDTGVFLAVGQTVLVRFNAGGGQLTATRVRDADDDDTAGSIEGFIDSVSGTTVVVGGLPFDVSNAQADGPVSLSAGSVVEMEFAFNGSFVVSKIESWSDDDGINDANGDGIEDSLAFGTVEGMTDGFIVVGGVLFDIRQAELDDEGTLEVGSYVKIEFFRTRSGEVIAIEVEIEDDDDDSDDDTVSNDDDRPDFILAGYVTDFTGNTVTIDGITVDLSLADVDDSIVIGGYVVVEFDEVNGLLVAVSAKATNSLSDDDLDDIDDDSSDDSDDSDDDSNDDSDDDSDDSDDDSNDDDDDCEPNGWYEYEVRRGDTMSSIAQAAGTTVSALAEANCISNPSLIRVGQEIYTPVAITSTSTTSGSSDDDDDDDDDNGSDDDDDSSDDDDGSDDDGSDDDGSDDDDSDDSDDDDSDDDDDDDDDDDEDDDDGDDD